MLDFLGDVLAGAISTSDTPQKRGVGWIILLVVLGLGALALVAYAYLENLEVTR
jgi:hypothetical protein